MQYTVYTKYIFIHAVGYIEGEFKSKMNKALLLLSIAGVIASLFLVANSLGNVWTAMQEADQAKQDLEYAAIDCLRTESYVECEAACNNDDTCLEILNRHA